MATQPINSELVSDINERPPYGLHTKADHASIDAIDEQVERLLDDLDGRTLDPMMLLRMMAELHIDLTLLEAVTHNHWPEAITEDNPLGIVKAVIKR